MTMTNKEVLGVMITKEAYDEYMALKKKNEPMSKKGYGKKQCPACGYTVDNAVPPQNYCDRCGQRLKN